MAIVDASIVCAIRIRVVRTILRGQPVVEQVDRRAVGRHAWHSVVGQSGLCEYRHRHENGDRYERRGDKAPQLASDPPPWRFSGRMRGTRVPGLSHHGDSSTPAFKLRCLELVNGARPPWGRNAAADGRPTIIHAALSGSADSKNAQLRTIGGGYVFVL